MRILYVSPVDLATRNGALEHVLGVAEGFAARGARVDLVIGDREGRPRPAAEADRLARHVVATRGRSTGGALAALAGEAWALAAATRPDVVYLRTFPLDWVLLARRLAAAGIPYVCELNSMVADEYRAQGKHLRGRLYAHFEARTLRGARGWLPVTHEIGRWAARTTGCVRPMLLARNGIDLAGIAAPRPRHEVRAALGVSEDAPVAIMAGFKEPWHGADRAAAAVARLGPAAELWLVGATGPDDHARAAGWAAEAGLGGRVRVFDWRDRDGVAELAGAADVGLGALALDRKAMKEAQALKVGLYLALGVPTLVNYEDLRLAAAPGFVAHVPSTDPADLAAGLARLLALPPAARAEARAFAEAHLSWRAVGAEALAFIEGVLGGDAARAA